MHMHGPLTHFFFYYVHACFNVSYSKCIYASFFFYVGRVSLGNNHQASPSALEVPVQVDQQSLPFLYPCSVAFFLLPASTRIAVPWVKFVEA